MSLVLRCRTSVAGTVLQDGVLLNILVTFRPGPQFPMSAIPATLLQSLREHSQTHLLGFWETLSEARQAHLVKQIESIDFGRLVQCWKSSIHPSHQESADRADKARSPRNVIRQPATAAERKLWADAATAGVRELEAGRVAVITVAGGQGTRLGFDHPKGMFPIGPVTDRSLFQIFAEQILARRSRHNASIPWLIMTSDATHDETVQFFASKSYFGLEPATVHFFQQGSLPALDAATGQILMSAPDQLALSPDGHGGLVQAVDSDSDVRLVDEDDSDVKLFDSDSDVRLTENGLAATGELDLAKKDSDSDVKLMGSEDILLDDSDSDVKLTAGLDRTDSDIRLADPSPSPGAPSDNNRTIAMKIVPEDSDLKLLNKGSGTRAGTPDSGISLDVRGSGLNLNTDDSGISLELDSGISLEADDSGISLESFDSGAKLGDDSGITLDADDSGISLDLDDDGPAVPDMSRTMPMQAIPGAARALADSSAMTTQLEIPAAVVGKDSEFELAGLDDDEEEVGTNTSVLTFEDDDVDSSRTIASPALSDEGFADDDGGSAEESYDEAESFDDDGGYEEDMDDVSDAEEFGDDDFESGQSQVGNFPTSARVGSRADVDWGMGVKILIGTSTLLSVGCAVIGIELVRTMWIWTQPGNEAPASAILEMIGGMF